jgi:hypothetical protein
VVRSNNSKNKNKSEKIARLLLAAIAITLITLI